MSSTPPKGFVFTGWHMLGAMVLFFGVIISVNLYMAWQATHTWSGLVVENTYIASQQFNGKVKEARALAASGVEGRLSLSDERVRYTLSHPDKGSVDADSVTLKFKRPVGEDQDFEMTLVDEGQGQFSAPHVVAEGTWIIEVVAVRDGKRILHHTERVSVAGDGP